ncbi:tyrosinase family oxidase copper chaperone [Streptomyces sp. NPDC048057]|uniref:tyrosinase family oxidase copper chaperone n=1 Tax=Streptomyces sp. NPDC048057 TaxID=3155628 RepID=UPI0034051B04
MRTPDQRGTSRRTRRFALRTLFTIGVVGGTAGALAPLVRHGGERTGAPDAAAAGAGAPDATERFAETYRGRRIEGSATVLVPARRATGVAPATAAEHTVEVRIDGRPLHVMRRADGSYLSAVNHYESFPTLRGAARAAVDDLGTARLAESPAHAL